MWGRMDLNHQPSGHLMYPMLYQLSYFPWSPRTELRGRLLVNNQVL